MRRIHLFEFEDFKWFPNVIRQGGTDYLRYFLKVTDFYSPVPKMLAGAIRSTGSSSLLDLCSGGGGAIENICRGLKKKRLM